VTYINPRGKPLAHLDRLAAWQAGKLAPPVTLEWDLSNRCSLGCAACHFAHTHTRGPWSKRDRLLPMMHSPGGDLADTALVRRALEGARDFGVRAVVWTGGGEPTLHPSWQEIVAYAHACGLQQGMYTLGGHLTLESASVLAALAQWVVVSLDADTAGVYAAEKGVNEARFDAACTGIGLLAAGQAKVGVSFLLHATNWPRVHDMLALTRKLGADYATFRPTVTTYADRPAIPYGDRSWVDAALPLLRRMATEPDVEVDPLRFEQWRDWLPGGPLSRSYADVGCHGIKLNATITPDLRVWVCPNRREFNDGSCLGNLSTEEWPTIWARHPGVWTDFTNCRALCRLHPVNETLGEVYRPREHEAFI
jgi:MoaA/NifB/PqqE/SkfB family radical SAM enzyme